MRNVTKGTGSAGIAGGVVDLAGTGWERSAFGKNVE